MKIKIHTNILWKYNFTSTELSQYIICSYYDYFKNFRKFKEDIKMFGEDVVLGKSNLIKWFPPANYPPFHLLVSLSIKHGYYFYTCLKDTLWEQRISSLKYQSGFVLILMSWE